MTPHEELCQALLHERYRTPVVREWKPEHHRAPLAARLDLLRDLTDDAAELTIVKEVA